MATTVDRMDAAIDTALNQHVFLILLDMVVFLLHSVPMFKVQGAGFRGFLLA